MRNFAKSQLVSKTLAEIAKLIEPGVTTEKLDKVAEEFIRDNKAIPGFLGYNDYPKTLCTSVNFQVVRDSIFIRFKGRRYCICRLWCDP